MTQYLNESGTRIDNSDHVLEYKDGKLERIDKKFECDWTGCDKKFLTS